MYPRAREVSAGWPGLMWSDEKLCSGSIRTQRGAVNPARRTRALLLSLHEAGFIWQVELGSCEIWGIAPTCSGLASAL